MKPSTRQHIFPLLLPPKHRRTTDQLGSTSSSLYDIVSLHNCLGTRANICYITLLLLQRRRGFDLSPSSVFHVGNQSGRRKKKVKVILHLRSHLNVSERGAGLLLLAGPLGRLLFLNEEAPLSAHFQRVLEHHTAL